MSLVANGVLEELIMLSTISCGIAEAIGVILVERGDREIVGHWITVQRHPAITALSQRMWTIHIDNAMAVDAAPSTPLTNAKRAYCPFTVAASNVIEYIRCSARGPLKANRFLSERQDRHS